MYLEKRKIIIIASIVGVGVIILSVVGFITSSNNTSQTESTYIDPSSGEKIAEDNKAPQGSDASLKHITIYPGFSKLIDRGLSPVQIQSIQSTITEYSLQKNETFTEVSLVVDAMEYVKSTEPNQTYALAFPIKVNRKNNYFITVDTTGDTLATTKIYASDKTTLLLR